MLNIYLSLLCKQMDKDNSKQISVIENKTIILDVGGQKMKTFKSTLELSPYFKSQFERWNLDTTNELFIDQDPNIFIHFLNFLRNTNYRIPEKLEENVNVLMEYYGFPVEKVEKRVVSIRHPLLRNPENIELSLSTIKDVTIFIRGYLLAYITIVKTDGDICLRGNMINCIFDVSRQPNGNIKSYDKYKNGKSQRIEIECTDNTYQIQKENLYLFKNCNKIIVGGNDSYIDGEIYIIGEEKYISEL